MQINVTQENESARIDVKGNIDEQGAEELKGLLASLRDSSVKTVTFDFHGVDRIGSAGIGQLLLLYKNLAVDGGAVHVVGLSPTLYELFQSLKLDTLFTLSRA